jgi:hypothetical protein
MWVLTESPRVQQLMIWFMAQFEMPRDRFQLNMASDFKKNPGCHTAGVKKKLI